VNSDISIDNRGLCEYYKNHGRKRGGGNHNCINHQKNQRKKESWEKPKKEKKKEGDGKGELGVSEA